MDQLSPYLPGVLLAYATFFVGLASPGPNILAVLGTLMSVGRRSGLALALGVAAGSFCWAMLSEVGLSALVASYAAALRVIKVAGVVPPLARLQDLPLGPLRILRPVLSRGLHAGLSAKQSADRPFR